MGKKNELATTVVCGHQIAAPELRKATEQIARLANNLKSNYIKMGALFIKVRDEQLYKGFPTARRNEDGTRATATLAEYAEECFGLSKSALYRMINVTENIYQPLLQLQAEGCSSMPAELLSLNDSSLNAMSGFSGYDGLAGFVKWIDEDYNGQVHPKDMSVRKFSNLCRHYIDHLNQNTEVFNEKVDAPQENNGEASAKQEVIKDNVKELQEAAKEIRARAEETVPEEVKESFEEAVFDLIETIGGSLTIEEIKELAEEFKARWFVTEGSDEA